MSSSRRIRYIEGGIYLLIWLVVILAPFFISGGQPERSWEFIFRGWKIMGLFFVVFCINNFLLAPRLLLKNKVWQYVACSLALVIGIAAVDAQFIRKDMEQKFMREQRMEAGRPPLPGHNFEVPPHDRMPLHEAAPMRKHMEPRPPLLGFGLLAICVLILGFNSGIKIFIRWTEEKSERGEREKQHLITELAYLKNQISPHFFMNTLNNIHALVDIDGEKAKEAIVKLSQLMRYLLYEPEAELTPLRKEINFLQSYVELMRLRYDEQMLSVETVYPEESDGVIVPPFLFLSFVENAFKYGANPRSKSSISMRFAVENNFLVFSIRNHTFAKAETGLDEGSGIGLENIKKRLQLIYRNSYFLSIKTEENEHVAELKIPTKI